MADDRQDRALGLLLQLRHLEALTAAREAQVAAARVAAVGQQIAGLDERVLTEATALRDYADAGALGRWADAMDGKRAGLVRLMAGEERRASQLAARATAANRVEEQHRELLGDHRRRLADQRRRSQERAEYEALSALFSQPDTR